MQHKYTSIAEVQVHMEDEYLRSPLSGVSVQVGMGRSSQVELGMLGLLGSVGLLCSLLGEEEWVLQEERIGCGRGHWVGARGILRVPGAEPAAIRSPGEVMCSLLAPGGRRSGASPC